MNILQLVSSCVLHVLFIVSGHLQQWAFLNSLTEIYTHIPFFTHRLNGSLPKNVEIRNNTLLFRGPVTYDFSGTYICDATNSIGTRSGLVEVNVTGM